MKQHVLLLLLLLFLREAELVSHGHLDLLLNQIHARDHLSHRVLHLLGKSTGQTGKQVGAQTLRHSITLSRQATALRIE